MPSLKGWSPGRVRRRSLAALCLALTAAACSGDSSGPATPSSIAPDVGTVPDGTVATVLSPAPGFTVKDKNGNIMGGVSVTVTVTAGGGTLTDAPTLTRSGGPTPVGQWTLGTVAGVNSVTITVGTLPPLVISVNGRAGPPASIAFVSGVDQSALAGTIVTPSPAAQVRDQFNNGVAGVAVTFAVIEGEGSVGGAPVTTSASGTAQAPQWRVGRSAIPQSLRATAAGLSAVVRAFITTDYSIELRTFGPPMPEAAAAAFASAAARISGAIIGDLPPAGSANPVDLTECGVPGVFFTGVVDDLLIYATVTPIDGPGNVLGNAGPCFIRTTGRQPVIGVMRFDSDDIQLMIGNGTLKDVIQHEMLHVVGFGTIWTEYNILLGAGTPQTRYTGALGVAACVSIGGGSVCPGSIPVEDQFGAGSADSHWRESIFGTELMTSRLGGGNNPFSTMSVQSLGDIGYITNQNAADSYSVQGQVGVRRSISVSETAPGWEVIEKPKFTITSTGRITPVEKR